MGFVILLIAVVAVALMICMGLNSRTREAQRRLKEELAKQASVEDKMAGVRKELSAAKEELAKRAKLLEEAREIGRKKSKKEAIASSREQEVESAQTDNEVERLKRVIHAMEGQVHVAREEVKAELKTQFERELQKQRDEVARLESQLGKRQQDTSKRKQDLESNLPKIDVATWSDDTVNEVARLLRKSEQLEKMNGVTHGKLQMAQERFNELQRRYFAVCRELALAAGHVPEVSDQQARDVAEVITSDAGV